MDSLRLAKTRLDRDLSVFQMTFEKFANLVEEARIARHQAAGDIQVVSRAVVAHPVVGGALKKVSISAAVALMVSAMLAFLLEYVSRARVGSKSAEPGPTS